MLRDEPAGHAQLVAQRAGEHHGLAPPPRHAHLVGSLVLSLQSRGGGGRGRCGGRGGTGSCGCGGGLCKIFFIR